MNSIKYILASLLCVSLFSCEEVVSVDLETAPPRLVVDAGIDWIKGTDGHHQVVRLTTTTGYYDTTIPVVSGAIVSITNASGTTFEFTEDLGTGNYVCDNFVPELEQTYVLSVVYQNEIFTATETLHSVPDISHVIQDNDGGFLGDEIEVRFFFQDDANVENYYYVRTEAPVLAFPELDTFSDEFFNGNESFGFFSDEDLEAGQTVSFTFHAVSRRYHEYIRRLIENAGGGNPFATTAATVRGNLINTTNASNYALGYFRVSEADTLDYVVE
ncbi:DUF4249 family protein [Flavobacterium silvaticum]|uniref:DUF4249 family protein n=1 Tax=Flavobacterium silvaticum TaxID=1852020 RepID=A0A972FRB1_9FLAO|nr:DUF4249 family protein [Flavobacterium silvaticum]NMH27934.1 DUF4249 family protein [Flavobacterium silvaticum]